MSLKERTYSILVVSSTDSFASAFIGSLPEIRYYPVLTASSVSAAKRMLKEKSFDFVIINSPLSDDIGVRFAIDLCSSRQIAVLLLVKRIFTLIFMTRLPNMECLHFQSQLQNRPSFRR